MVKRLQPSGGVWRYFKLNLFFAKEIIFPYYCLPPCTYLYPNRKVGNTIQFFQCNFIHYNNYYAGKFIKSVYGTTMTKYKAVLRQRNKGTGGCPGLNIYFKLWDAVKLTKYDLDPGQYDHIQVTNCSPILIDSYHQDDIRKPYITVIHLWNAILDNLLSSKYDPFEGSNRKVGLECSDESSVSTKGNKTKSSSPNKRRDNSGSPSAESSTRRKIVDTIVDTSEEIRTAVEGAMEMFNEII